MRFYSHGKLLITAEYAVLDGAQAFCLPTKKGQYLEVKENTSGLINWVSKDEDGKVWFQDQFEKTSFGIKSTSETQNSENDAEISKRCIQILTAAEALSGKNLFEGYDITTELEFDRNWGLGTSSTLINNIAQWLEIDAYQLLEKTFKGSGYDIACAQAEGPITYERTHESQKSLKATFTPDFTENIYFVYLNQKQNSREAIAHYRNQTETHQKVLVEKVSNITQQLLKCETLAEFELLLNIHESLISKAINLPKVKTKLFPDFEGSIKSLGAWGGDFVMVTSKNDPKAYFEEKGYNVLIAYEDLIL
ncbi:GYDIA family GHMP kinase [Zunongwangia endophytica]|uniref:GYDIA family GHMP kinase n=1 Tax=Zunongwangia endophytica TaxID=1808945 RepID=A0ABV8H8C8_9FLAO|nr:GYDIA family GHMP kinase [Zunongwangia endophytica]MDN3596329.1 GYDIA family GHMP kinase [Zunongwangia endophytica]